MKRALLMMAVACVLGGMSVRANAQQGVANAQTDLDTAVRCIMEGKGEAAVKALEDFGQHWPMGGHAITDFKVNGKPMTESTLTKMTDDAYGVWAQNYLDTAVSELKNKNGANARTAISYFERKKGMADKELKEFTIDGQPLTKSLYDAFVQRAAAEQ